MAQALTLEFLSNLPRVRDLLQTDTEAAFQGDPAALSKEEVIVAYPFIEAIAVQRLAHELYLQQVPLIPRIMTEWAHGRTGIDLHPGARSARIFLLTTAPARSSAKPPSLAGTSSSTRASGWWPAPLRAASRCAGKNGTPPSRTHVTIYANATIVGGETVVGAGSTIGASVFLNQSVPPHSLVTYEKMDIKVTKKQDRADSRFPDLDGGGFTRNPVTLSPVSASVETCQCSWTPCDYAGIAAQPFLRRRRAGLVPECGSDPAADSFIGARPTLPCGLPLRRSWRRFFPGLEIMEVAGHGGMGTIYKARQPQLDRVVALKILSPELGRDPAFAATFFPRGPGPGQTQSFQHRPRVRFRPGRPLFTICSWSMSMASRCAP